MMQWICIISYYYREFTRKTYRIYEPSTREDNPVNFKNSGEIRFRLSKIDESVSVRLLRKELR